MATFTLERLAGVVGGEPSIVPGPDISGVRPLEFAEPGDITYVADERNLKRLAESRAGAVLVPPSLGEAPLPAIVVRNPEAAFARLTALFYPLPAQQPGVSPRADVHPDATIGQNVSVGAFAVVERGAVIGDETVIGHHAVVGEEARIGSGTRIFPQVTIYPRVRIGDRVIIHSGTVIGADGFGYARDVDPQGRPLAVKKYHSGTVEIEDDVEIGALCAVDRALAGVTRLGRGVKVDNLVQIAHSVQVGEGTVIASQSGIAGSSSVGRFCMIGGQVGVRDHVAVGDGVVLATRVGIYRNVPDGSVMAGSVPAMPHSVFLRAQGLFKRLPEMLERIRKLESLMQSKVKES
ncbi:MAG: UDP-3-O-(3-hydroxymyristoyl)glucosamine N-acyltransferase [Desulfomonile sp.]|nr:UDP-3-O-(3-hydroxymyristoyl)glucosamine N-acyltransferase [Desulfomonile sp.]